MDLNGVGLTEMNWQLDFNIVLQILTVAAFAGMGWQKLKIIERDVIRLEQEMIDFRDLKADLLVVKSQLSSIAEKLNHFAHAMEIATKKSTKQDN
jgi:Tfp pilus assembly protein PilO